MSSVIVDMGMSLDPVQRTEQVTQAQDHTLVLHVIIRPQ